MKTKNIKKKNGTKESLRWICTLRFVYIYMEYAHDIFNIFVDLPSL